MGLSLNVLSSDVLQIFSHVGNGECHVAIFRLFDEARMQEVISVVVHGALAHAHALSNFGSACGIGGNLVPLPSESAVLVSIRF